MKVSFVTFLSIVLLFACGNPCDDVVCNNNGVCIEGICDCQMGYEGVNCDTESRTAFLGQWNSANFGCDGLLSPTSIQIAISSVSAAHIELIDIANPNFIMIGEIDASKLTIPSQQIDGLSVSGNGTLNSNELTLSLNFDGIQCGGLFMK